MKLGLGDIVSLPVTGTKWLFDTTASVATAPYRNAEAAMKREARRQTALRLQLEEEEKRREQKALVAAEQERRELLLRRGRRSTMLSGPSGLMSLENKSLLGG